MNIQLEDLNLDWDNNFALPVANAENKLLEESIKRLTADRSRFQNEYSQNSSKVEALKDHIKYVKDELYSTQVSFSYLSLFHSSFPKT
jgi:hypothetical protein